MTEEGDKKAYIDSVTYSSNLSISNTGGDRIFSLTTSGSDQNCNITVTIKTSTNSFMSGLAITSTADGGGGLNKG